jgi:hypothetical protein
MKVLSSLGFGITVGLLATACSSSTPTPASTGSTSGTSSGSGTGSTSGAGTGTASGTASGTTSGTASGAGTGSASGSTSGATSGSTTEAGTPEAGTPEASTEAGTPEASTEAGPVEASTTSDAATATSLNAACNAAGSPYHTSMTGMAFTPEDFCTVFLADCTTEIIASETTALGTQSACEATYAGWTTAQKECRTDHLCNAAASATAAMTHCYHAYGWSDATTVGGPCP